MLRKKGQSTLEYAVVIAVVVAALVIMQMYVRRGFQGRLRQSADDIGEQFAPGAITYDWSETVSQDVGESIDASARITTSYTTDRVERSGSQSIDMTTDNYWPTGGP